MYVTVNIDLAVQIDPVILLVDLVRLKNQPMECFSTSIYATLDQSERKTIFTVTYTHLSLWLMLYVERLKMQNDYEVTVLNILTFAFCKYFRTSIASKI